jgi:hypothetical protein
VNLISLTHNPVPLPKPLPALQKVLALSPTLNQARYYYLIYPNRVLSLPSQSLLAVQHNAFYYDPTVGNCHICLLPLKSFFEFVFPLGALVFHN